MNMILISAIIKGKYEMLNGKEVYTRKKIIRGAPDSKKEFIPFGTAKDIEVYRREMHTEKYDHIDFMIYEKISEQERVLIELKHLFSDVLVFSDINKPSFFNEACNAFFNKVQEYKEIEGLENTVKVLNDLDNKKKIKTTEYLYKLINTIS